MNRFATALVLAGATAGIHSAARASLNVFLDFNANWASELNQAAFLAGGPGTPYPDFTIAERQQIEANVKLGLEAVYSAYQVSFLLAPPPSGVYDTINFGADDANDTGVGVFGQAPLHIGNYLTEGAIDILAENFASHIDDAPLRADQISQISNAITNVAAHEMGHSLGLNHHNAFGHPQITPATYLTSGALVRTSIMASTVSTGESETDRETPRTFNRWERAMLDITGGTFLNGVFNTGVSLVNNPIIEVDEAGDAGSTPASAAALNFTLGETSGMQLSMLHGELDNTASDVDVFKITTASAGLATVEIFSSNSGYSREFNTAFNAKVRLLDTDGTTVLREMDDISYSGFGFDEGSFKGLDPFLLNIPLPGAGTYFIEVSPGSDNAVGDDYQLLVGFDGLVAGPRSWNVDADGNWSDGANWQLPSAPNSVDAVATFGPNITDGRTVTVDAPQTVGTLNFSSDISYTLAGTGTITMDVTSGPAAVVVTAGGHFITAPMVLNDDLIIYTEGGPGILLQGELTATGRSITKLGAALVQFTNIRAAALNVAEGIAQISEKATPNSSAGTSIVQALSIGGSATLDLTNNSLVIDYTGAVGSLVDEVRQYLQSGQLMTSSITPAGTKLGYIDNNGPALPTFGGLPVDPSSILIKFTYAGDANLDGQVDISDLAALATSWQTAGVWASGDFDYSGLVDISDLAALATNWQAGVGAPLGQSFEAALASLGLGGVAVPEPATLGILNLAAAARRRRRSGR